MLLHPIRDFKHPIRVSSDNPYANIRIGRRAYGQRAHVRGQVRETRVTKGLGFLPRDLRGFVRSDIDDHQRIPRNGTPRIVSEREPRLAPADVRGPIYNPLRAIRPGHQFPAHKLLHLMDDLLRPLDGRAERQFKLKSVDRLLVAGEEDIGDESGDSHNQHKNEGHDRKRSQTVSKETQHHPAISPIKFGIVRSLLRPGFHLQETRAQKRRHRQGQNPRRKQGDGHHLEQGRAEFSHAGFREIDGQKRRRRGQRRREQRNAQFIGGVHRRVESLFAGSHLHHNGFGHHDGVVHQHPQRNNQRRDGHHIQPDAENGHQQHRHHHRHRHEGSHHQPGPKSQKNQHHQHHNADRLKQRRHKVVDLLLHPSGLIRDRVELDADGIKLLKPGHQRGDLLAQNRDVPAFPQIDRQRQRGHARRTHLRLRRVNGPPVHVRQIRQVDQILFPRDTDQRAPHVLHGLETPRRLQRNPLPIRGDLAPRRDDILILQDAHQIGRGKPQLR